MPELERIVEDETHVFTDQKSLDNFQDDFASLLNAYLPKTGQIVNGIAYDPRAVKALCKVTRHNMHALYHLSLGETNDEIAEHVSTTKRNVTQELKNIYTKLSLHIEGRDDRITSALIFRSAYPHLFPKPKRAIELTSEDYNLAMQLAKGLSEEQLKEATGKKESWLSRSIKRITDSLQDCGLYANNNRLNIAGYAQQGVFVTS